jgi:hypothetical protein
MANYYIVKNQVVNNSITSDIEPTAQAGEIILNKDTVGSAGIGQIYLTGSQTFLDPLRGWFSFNQDQFSITDPNMFGSSSISVTLSYTRDINPLSIGTLSCNKGTINDFSNTSNGATFDLILNDEITGSTNLEEISLSVIKSPIGAEYGEAGSKPTSILYYTGSELV